jgi:hemerythrin superfamily protein
MPGKATSKSSSKTTSKAAHRAGKGSSQDALHILMDDHRKVIEMFEEFEEMKQKGSTDDEAKQMLVETACTELTIHAQVEEELFYPAARDAIDDMDLLDEAEVEHASARQLISELAAMQPDDDLYDAKFTVLGEYVKHHIQEEEKQLFPKIKKTDMELEELGEEIEQRKLELREELGVAPDDEDDYEDAEPGKPSHRRVH